MNCVDVCVYVDTKTMVLQAEKVLLLCAAALDTFDNRTSTADEFIAEYVAKLEVKIILLYCHVTL